MPRWGSRSGWSLSPLAHPDRDDLGRGPSWPIPRRRLRLRAGRAGPPGWLGSTSPVASGSGSAPCGPPPPPAHPSRPWNGQGAAPRSAPSPSVAFGLRGSPPGRDPLSVDLHPRPARSSPQDGTSKRFYQDSPGQLPEDPDLLACPPFMDRLGWGRRLCLRSFNERSGSSYAGRRGPAACRALSIPSTLQGRFIRSVVSALANGSAAAVAHLSNTGAHPGPVRPRRALRMSTVMACWTRSITA